MRLFKLVAIILVAIVLGYVIALCIGIVAFDFFDVSQREGANAMGLAFFISPLFAVISGVIAGVWYWRASGRTANMPEGDEEGYVRAKSGPVLTIAGAAMAGYVAGLLLQWMLAGRSFETFLVALAVLLAPWIAATVFGGIAWWRMSSTAT